jgi:hypothetical protein
MAAQYRDPFMRTSFFTHADHFIEWRTQIAPRLFAVLLPDILKICFSAF